MVQLTVQNDWKCAITNAVLVTLVYVLLVKLLGDGAGAPWEQASLRGNPWVSLEILLPLSAILAFKLNEMIFGSCNL